MMWQAAIFAVLVAIAAAGCGPEPTASDVGTVMPVPRRAVVWLGQEGIDQPTASRLGRAGVDQLVVRLGTISLAGGSPVLRLAPAPPVTGPIPVAIALRVDGIRAGLADGVAADVWRGIVAGLDGVTPSEIVLDLPELAPEVAGFVSALSEESGVSVVPLLSVEQLRSREGVRVARAARAAVVPVLGTGHPSLRGTGELATLSLAERLAPLTAEPVRVRLAVSLQPLVDPDIAVWGEDLDLLTEQEYATVSTSSVLDRTFLLQRELEWSSRRWPAGSAVAVRWLDCARLHNGLVEADRLSLPELAGWDVVALPPETGGLGISREALISYLGGEGPAPEPSIRAELDRSRLKVVFTNPGPFATAVSTVGNWVEVSSAPQTLVAEGRGDFDRLELGTTAGGDWRPKFVGAPDAVRLLEIYLAPGEEVVSGPIRLSSPGAGFRVRWQLVLTSGELVTGTLER